MDPQNLSKSQFRELLQRYIENKVSPIERQFIETWYKSIGSEAQSGIGMEELAETETRIWNSIQQPGLQPVQQPFEKRRAFWYTPLTRVAASLLLVGLVAVFFLLKKSPDFRDKVMVSDLSIPFYVENISAFPKSVTMADGSIVLLQPQSSLRAGDIQKGERREVFLEGEAFFEVAHDIHRPFYVYAGPITTKVLGTSFTVSTRGKSSFVAVSTGKVLVSQTTQKSLNPLHTLTEEIILTPNQKAVFNGDEMLRTLIDKPKRLVTEDEQPLMKFDDESVAIILGELEDAYGVEIDFDETLLKTCKLTTSLSNEDLYDRLNIICKAIKGTYQIEGAKVIITSKGCN